MTTFMSWAGVVLGVLGCFLLVFVLIMAVTYVINERSKRYVVTPSRSATGPAFVEIVSIRPASGSSVTFNTLIWVELAYQIQVIEPDATYVLTTTFQTVDGGITRNHWDDTLLREQAGTVKRIVTLYDELADPRVAKPLKCVFTLLQVKGDAGRSIADSEPVVYEFKRAPDHGFQPSLGAPSAELVNNNRRCAPPRRLLPPLGGAVFEVNRGPQFDST